MTVRSSMPLSPQGIRLLRQSLSARLSRGLQSLMAVLTAALMAPAAWAGPVVESEAGLATRPVVTGVHYSIGGGGYFRKVGITSGFGDLHIRLTDDTLWDLFSNTTFDFEANGLAPAGFEIIGLALDPTAPGFNIETAFPTFLQFTGPASTLVITPTIVGGGTVPVPGTWPLLLCGLALGAVISGRPAGRSVALAP